MSEDFYRFKLGAFECIAFSDGSLDYPPRNFFANVQDAEIAAALRERNLPTEFVRTPYTCLYVNTGTNRVLVDVGAGRLTPTTGKLLGSMKAAGIAPEEIDTVIITHAHPDHVGGNLDDDGKPLYTRAQYFIWKDEWEFWTSPEALPKTSEFFVTTALKHLEPVQDRLHLLDQEAEIVPGIRALAAPGHTPGHIAVSIRSNAKQLLHIADTVLYPLHLEHPAWLPIYDISPELAATSKRRIFDLAADEQALVFAHHFPPFPNTGYVVRAGDGWAWQPHVG